MSYDRTSRTPTSPKSTPPRQFAIVAVCRSLSGEADMETIMGKYVVAWLLGVPAFVLVIVYMFAH
jgi:hypothetical protein